MLLGQGNDNECSPRAPGNGGAKRENGIRVDSLRQREARTPRVVLLGEL